MHDPAQDERMRRLQRLAYGAVASDADRAAAVAELESLRREAAASEARGEPVDDTGLAASGAATSPGPIGEPAPPPAAPVSPATLKWAIAIGTVALLAGVCAGWQIGTRTVASEPSAAAASAAPELNGFMIPIADTAVPRMFEADPTPADVPQVPYLDDRIAPTDYRLLLTRPDGVALHVARLGGDVCVVVVDPGGGTASACTVDGRFPETGLWVEGSGQGRRIRGIIQPDGTAALTPAGYLPDLQPSTEG